MSGVTLAGSGSVTGNVAVAFGGSVAPGGSASSAGTLTVAGDLDLSSGGAITFDLAGAATLGGGVNGQIQLTGTSGNLLLNSNPVTINPLVAVATGTPYTLINFCSTTPPECKPSSPLQSRSRPLP